MSFNAIFTLRSLEVILQRSSDIDWLDPIRGFVQPDWGVARVVTNATVFYLHHEDTPETQRIVLIDVGGGNSIDRLPRDAWRPALQRVYRAALAARDLPFRLPLAWCEYHSGNLVAFFACGRSGGFHRWIMEIGVLGSGDLCFWRITDDVEQLVLSEYKPPDVVYKVAIGGWDTAIRRAGEETFSQLTEPPRYAPLDGTIDLTAATYGAVTGHLTYSGWVERLTDEQRKFFNHPSSTPVKLRGPAGSGKTLALELKALKETYLARDTGRTIRVLFVTHSWAMAEQVDRGLRSLDEMGVMSDFAVFPLIEIAKSVLPSFESIAKNSALLGEDSYSGRRLLLDQIEQTLWRFRTGDWLGYEVGASSEFKERMKAQRGSPEWNSLVWDLMHEFSSVISASGILPGITAEKRYLALRRLDWMMPLTTESEKKLVLRVYSEHIALLRSNNLLSTDQLVNDLVSYLETFAWDYRRGKDGFDLIFVDEMHLFSDQERLALNYLSRDAGRFPSVFMAMDPRQAPTEIYADFQVANVGSAQNVDTERNLGKVDSVDLTRIHRFSPQILELVKFIHRSYPTLKLGDDYLIDSDTLESSASTGEVPRLFPYSSPSVEVTSVVRRAGERQVHSGSSRRVALVLIDDGRLKEFQDETIKQGLSVVTLKSRDDIDLLRYTKRAVVLSAADYVAGLQFDEVLVAGFPTVLPSEHLSVPQQRRILAALYVAVSRASLEVEIHIHTEIGDIASLLQRAAAAGVLESY